MSPARDTRETPPGMLTAVLRDPLVPLGIGGWLRRVGRVLRDDAKILTALAGVLGLLDVAFRIAIELSAPSLDDIGRQLLAAGKATPDGFVNRWTVFRIAYLPTVPAFVIFFVLLAVTNAFCCGGAYYRAVRQANGQPTSLATALRAATPRVLPFIGWYTLAFASTALAFGALLLPGAITHNPWLNIIGPTIAALLIVVAAIVVLPTIFGVVFLEQRGLWRCVQLVKGRFRLTAGRTLVAGAAVGLYLAATAGVMKLLLRPFGGPDTLALPYSAIEYLVNGLLHLPLFGVIIAATLITYAELRFHENPSTTTRTLANDVPV
jgi:hypothetical protein